MSYAQIIDEIHSDLDQLPETLERISGYYDRNRKSMKIGLDAGFSLPFKTRSPSGNEWIFVLDKNPEEENYRGAESIKICRTMYVNGGGTLRVFIPDFDNHILVLEESLFTIYAKRMELFFLDQLETIKWFLMHNCFCDRKIMTKGETGYMVALAKEGLILGVVKEEGKYYSMETFIPYEHKELHSGNYLHRLEEKLKSAIDEALRQRRS